MSSEKKINDNEWHIVIFKRQQNYGQLSVDEDEAVTGYSQGTSETMNVSPPFYVGGVLRDMSNKVLNTIVSKLSMKVLMCLKIYFSNGKLLIYFRV